MPPELTTGAWPLKPGESVTLRYREKVVAEGLESAREVGEALRDIRDQKLYRGTHATFAAYCQDRWGLGTSAVYQFIHHANILDACEKAALPLPQSEAVTRPLRFAPRTERVQTWTAFLQTGQKPTQKAVQAFVRTRYPSTRKPPARRHEPPSSPSSVGPRYIALPQWELGAWVMAKMVGGEGALQIGKIRSLTCGITADSPEKPRWHVHFTNGRSCPVEDVVRVANFHEQRRGEQWERTANL